jgi:hypothetical protein
MKASAYAVDVPQGHSFQEAMLGAEVAAGKQTDHKAPLAGEKAPACWKAAWSFIESIYRYATCATQCPGNKADHTFRYIAGRATNLALGALSNLRGGHYDASLLVIRGIGELANVSTVLVHSPSALASFKTGRSLRGKEFAKLHELGVKPIVSGTRYGLLSARAVHPSFDELVKTHTPRAIVVGPIFQEAGFLLCLNELAIALAGFIHLVRDPTMSTFEREALRKATKALGDSIGSIRIDNIPPGFRMPLPADRWQEPDPE